MPTDALLIQSSMPHRAPQIAAGRHGHYVTVAIDRGVSSVEKELTYGVPPELRAVLQPGFAVLVPLGRQTLTGYVTGFATEIDFDPKYLRFVVRPASRAPLFDARTLKLARWMSAYYHCSLSECLNCLVPHGWQLNSERHYAFAAEDVNRALSSLLRSPRQMQVAQVLMKSERPLSQKQIEKSLHEKSVNDRSAKSQGVEDALKKLVEQGIVTVADELLDPGMKPRRVQAVRLLPSAALDEEQWRQLEKTARKQALALRQLWALQNASELEIEGTAAGAQSTPSVTVPSLAVPSLAVPALRLAREFGIDAGILRGLEKKGYVEFTTVEQGRAPTAHMPQADVKRVQLTDEQSTAVAAIAAALREVSGAKGQETHVADAPPETPPAAPGTLLLQGVTASGKTEVYLAAIEHCLQLGRRALVLVPEIALTAQTVEIFQRRFQERVAILHSALGAGERFDEWRRARSGRADIVVGARSAIFAPCRDIGLIIIDEEHDHSYKQDATPRYHVRDVALKRAALENAVLVLGSATPSLESYYHATRGDYGHLKMTRRIGTRRMPDVEIVDMTEEARMGRLPVLSRRLQDALCETVARGEQAIIFLNRRGFATYVQCLGCGHVERCINCDVSLTYHRGARELRCHHCGYVATVPEACRKCEGWLLGFDGTGTEKVENEVVTLLRDRGLSEVATLRLDRDTTSQKGAHGKILGEFRQGRAQVLIGTQMVTKGLDFPKVTLVGVISADTALNVPDFRAAERTFQLLAQVGGRAGRGDEHGRVLVQTLTTDHYAIQAACTHDYEMFIQNEIEARQSPAYPPYSHIINIISADEDVQVAQARIEELAVQFLEAIEREGGGTELLGPVDCPLARVKSKFRFHLMLRDRNRPRLHRVLGVYDRLARDAKEGLTVDVDAASIL
ncbi:MAG TPA: primosomal protein N', partial [Abditibacteriaceae bacterium]|nr:primosomal protein N' [Abditibacteriaceae bacterium]